MSRRNFAALLLWVGLPWLAAPALLLIAQEPPEPALHFSCIWWDSVTSQPPPGMVLQMGTCFNTDHVARSYLVNVDGRGWEPVDKTRCTPRLGQEHPFECFVRFTKLYYGIDREIRIAEEDDLTRQSDVTRTRHIRTAEDESFGEAPMVPGFNQMIDEPGSVPPFEPTHPPDSPAGVRIR